MPIEILPGIWLGYNNDLYNRFFLVNNKIESIISPIKFNNKTNIEFIHIPINENESIKLNNIFIDYIYDLVNYIHKKNRNYKNILIYCKSGEQLSPSIIACYLIKYGDILPDKAIQIIKTKSNKAFIDNCLLLQSLYKFYNKINT